MRFLLLILMASFAFGSEGIANKDLDKTCQQIARSFALDQTEDGIAVFQKNYCNPNIAESMAQKLKGAIFQGIQTKKQEYGKFTGDIQLIGSRKLSATVSVFYIVTFEYGELPFVLVFQERSGLYFTSGIQWGNEAWANFRDFTKVFKGKIPDEPSASPATSPISSPVAP